jgi:hypothetical protein
VTRLEDLGYDELVRRAGEYLDDIPVPSGAGYGQAVVTADPWLRERAVAILRKFNPAEPRDPKGRWVDTHPGDSGHGVAHWLGDALDLDGRVDLAPGERLVGSDEISLDESDTHLLFAVIDSDRGREIRLGVIPREDVGKWKAADLGGTASLTPREAAHLRDDLTDARDQAKKAAKAAEKAWNSSRAPTDPKLLGTEPVAQMHPPTVPADAPFEGWAELSYEVYLTDDEPISYRLELTSTHPGTLEEYRAVLGPDDLGQFVDELGHLVHGPSKSS